MSSLLPQSLCWSSGWGNVPRFPVAVAQHKMDAGVSADFPFQLHLSQRKGSRQALGCSSSLRGGVQFSGGPTGCTLGSDLEAREGRVLEAENHLRAVQEQQVPAFLTKKKAKTKPHTSNWADVMVV